MATPSEGPVERAVRALNLASGTMIERKGIPAASGVPFFME